MCIRAIPYGSLVEDVPAIRLRSASGIPIEARCVPFGQEFGPHRRYVNRTGENVVDFYRLRPYRGPAHLVALAASHILGLGPEDSLPVAELKLRPPEVERLRRWLESPFAHGEELV